MNENSYLLDLKEKRKKILDELSEIDIQIEKVELDKYQLEGKYIYLPDRGYMFVTCFKIDRQANIFLQGFFFDSSLTPYQDSFYFMSDALQEIRISLKEFGRLMRNNLIKQMTKEEFLEEFNKQLIEFQNKFPLMLEQCTTDYDPEGNG